MLSYIQVAEGEEDEAIEVPCEDDHNHSILLSTLTSLFPGASGLKYRNSETGTIRGIRLIGGRLEPPEEGWTTTSVYYCAFPKGFKSIVNHILSNYYLTDNKRKMKDQTETPNHKTKRIEAKSQQKDSSLKKRKLDEEKTRKEEERVRREEEKARKDALKEEERVKKEALKEEERLRREQEKARKEALKEEERIRREEEKVRKDALKEEERVRKEEERARKEEEKLKERQKETEKQEKQKNILRNFFIKKTSEESINRKNVLNIESTANGLFLPFQLSENQTIAPIVPESAKKRFNRQVLDGLLVSQDSNHLYLDLLKSVDYKPFRSNRENRSQPEIIIESQSGSEENQPKRYRVKRLQFHENVRPPYRGTYRKISTKLKATQPFKKDTSLFDYDNDSDEEWDEGGPGESLDGSESDGSVKDDYEIDNEFFVPHGYLSEDENDENEDKAQNIVDIHITDENNDQKDLKCRPLLKEQVLMAERNRSFSSSLTPIVLGCVWETNENKNKSLELLQSYKRMSITTK